VRLLLTGSSGFIGRRIRQAATAAGLEVRTIDRVAVEGARPDVQADLIDATALDDALTGVDVVCHQAAKVGLGVRLGDMPDYVRDNDLGTAQLLAAMDRHRVRSLVLASSMVVYGEGAYRCEQHGAQPAPPRRTADLVAGRFDPVCPRCRSTLVPTLVSEDAPLDPRNAYAASKVAQEHLSRVWAHSADGRVIALRYHNVYGPGMPRDTPYAGVASIFRSHIASGQAPQVFEDGRQRRDFVHVDDVVSANMASLAALADSAGDTFSVYNVGSGHVRSVHDLAVALSQALGGRPPEVTGEFRTGDVRHITASSERIRRQLGWGPRVPFSEGIAELAASTDITTA
jgi:dTDP-L-rhamnose 4-epimerase